MKKILIVAAHPDDEILGAGATLARLVKEDAQVRTVILGEGVTSRDQSRNADNRTQELSALKASIIAANKAIGITDCKVYQLPDNRFDSIDLIDVIKIVEAEIDDFKPDTIFTHWQDDVNIDHRITFQAVLTATRPFGNQPVKELLSFEILSSSEWNFGRQFSPDYYFDVSNSFGMKLKSLESYNSEMRKYPHPRSAEGVVILAQKRGMEIGCYYAEAFKLIRKVR